MTSAHRLRLAARTLLAGGVVAHPTEGVYGLACLPLDDDAVARVLALKGRAPEAGFVYAIHTIAPHDPLWYIEETAGDGPLKRIPRALLIGVGRVRPPQGPASTVSMPRGK